MKTDFKAKFLQHVAKKRKEEGFTLIELLVVIIIIGILSAIALPSFLNQANKAKQSEAKQYIASIAKGQQAYYAEEGTFITNIANIDTLGLGIKTVTQNYTYALEGSKAASGGVNSYTAEAASGLRVYAGLIYLTEASGALTSITVMCEGDAAATIASPGTGKTACKDTTNFQKPL